MNQNREAIGKKIIERIKCGPLLRPRGGTGRKSILKKSADFSAKLVAKKECVSNERIAARFQAGQQGVLLVSEIGTNNRGDSSPQAVILEEHDLTSRYSASRSDVECEAQARQSSTLFEKLRSRAEE